MDSESDNTLSDYSIDIEENSGVANSSKEQTPRKKSSKKDVKSKNVQGSDNTISDYSIETDEDEPLSNWKKSTNKTKKEEEKSNNKNAPKKSKAKNDEASDDTLSDYSIEMEDDEPPVSNSEAPSNNTKKEEDKSDSNVTDNLKMKNDEASDNTVSDYSIEMEDDSPKKNDTSTVEQNNDTSTVEQKTEPPKKVKKDKNPPGKTGRKNLGYTTGLQCRICLKQCRPQSKSVHDLADIYFKCTGFVIKKKEKPNKICYPCYCELMKVESFIDKCTTTEEKLSKGDFSPTKPGADEDEEDECDEEEEKKSEEKEKPDEKEKNENISDISDVEVGFEGEDSDESNFSDTLVVKKKKRKVTDNVKTKPKKEKKPKEKKPKEKKEPKKSGRPPKDPSEVVPRRPKGRLGRPTGSVKKPGSVPKTKLGRPKSGSENKTDVHTTSENITGEHKIEREDGTIAIEVERQICFVCGKLVRKKHLPYHIWKHKKDEEATKSTTMNGKSSAPTCEFCHRVYKSQSDLTVHMKRIHPGVAYGMYLEKEKSPEPDLAADNFDREFRIPTKDDYIDIQSPYNHNQALFYLQKSMRK